MKSHLRVVIDALKAGWGIPRQATHRGELCPFRLVCEFAPTGANHAAIEVLPSASEEVRQFWSLHERATLFRDVDYGQWGLRVLAPSDSLDFTARYRAARRKDGIEGDLIIGEFLGDSDLLMLRTDRDRNDYGSVVVVLPLYPRKDWYRVASSFEGFLAAYAEAEGDKFWEV